MEKRYIAVAILLGISLIGILATPVSAQSRLQQAQEQTAEKISDRCEIITQRISLIISRYELNKETHIDRYNRIKDSIQQLLVRLDENGIGTTDLKGYLAGLELMISDFANSYTQFVNQLQQAQSFACGNSEGEFKDSVTTAKQYLSDARLKSLEIRTYIVEVIKPEIREIKDKIR